MKNAVKIMLYVLVLCGSLLLPVVGRAYVEVPALETFVAKSELICLGTVTTKREIGKNGTAVLYKLWVEPESILKGTVSAKGKIEVFAFQTAPDQMKQIEDPMPPLPEKGSRVMLFLERKDGTYSPFSSYFGVLRIDKNGNFSPFPQFSQPQLQDALKHLKK